MIVLKRHQASDGLAARAVKAMKDITRASSARGSEPEAGGWPAMVSRLSPKSAKVGVAPIASRRHPWPQNPTQLENARKPRYVYPPQVRSDSRGEWKRYHPKYWGLIN